jgi:hypothetical protein
MARFVLAMVMVLGGLSCALAAPRDVARYIGRREGCNHWAGEEGYDAARRAEINKAIDDLRCTVLDKDGQVLRHRYRHSPAISRALKKAQADYPV